LVWRQVSSSHDEPRQEGTTGVDFLGSKGSDDNLHAVVVPDLARMASPSMQAPLVPNWWIQQAAASVEARACKQRQPESTVGASIESWGRGRHRCRQWERWRLVQVAAPIDPPVATSASLWPSTHRRLAAAQGGAPASRPLSLAVTEQC
jgi:hypothetical protein